MTATPVIVAIPARNEAGHIGACLSALAAQPSAHTDIAGVIVYANNCTDATVAAVKAVEAPFPIALTVASLPPDQAHIGHARRGATDAALAFMQARGFADAIIAGTDADSRVAPDWLAALQRAFSANVDAVCGAIDIVGAARPTLAAALTLESAHADMTAQTAARLDPLAHDPWPNHIWCWGANLAVRARALIAVGGTPLVDLAEDRALHEALLRHDMPVRHARSVRVSTSARADGRAPGGFADLLASYADDPAALADYYLEPAGVSWRRAHQRGTFRRAWGDRPGFGAWWADHQSRTPALARQRVTIAALANETALLKAWLAAAADQSDNSRCAAGAPQPHPGAALR